MHKQMIFEVCFILLMNHKKTTTSKGGGFFRKEDGMSEDARGLTFLKRRCRGYRTTGLRGSLFLVSSFNLNG
jgi:hypothetical protein